jgi:transcriptional regulator with XRE-family HTH domain
MALECHLGNANILLVYTISSQLELPTMGLSKNIAYRLRTLREAAGLSQQEVADKADLSLSLITKMEQARKADPRASTILALATALGVRPGQLIEDLTPPPEGMFPGKDKKDKKEKKKKKKEEKRLAKLAASTSTANGVNGSRPDAVGVASSTLGVITPEDEDKKTKDKKKKKKEK